MSAPGYFEKAAKAEMRMCKRLYCNPKCARVGVNKSDLVNDFNKNLDTENLQKLKKDGAISGCYKLVI